MGIPTNLAALARRVSNTGLIPPDAISGSVGGGGFRGNSGLVGTAASGDIFRVHAQTLTSNTTIASNENALCAGPLTIANNVVLTVESGGNLVIT